MDASVQTDETTVSTMKKEWARRDKIRQLFIDQILTAEHSTEIWGARALVRDEALFMSLNAELCCHITSPTRGPFKQFLMPRSNFYGQCNPTIIQKRSDYKRVFKYDCPVCAKKMFPYFYKGLEDKDLPNCVIRIIWKYLGLAVADWRHFSGWAPLW